MSLNCMFVISLDSGEILYIGKNAIIKKYAVVNYNISAQSIIKLKLNKF